MWTNSRDSLRWIGGRSRSLLHAGTDGEGRGPSYDGIDCQMNRASSGYIPATYKNRSHGSVAFCTSRRSGTNSRLTGSNGCCFVSCEHVRSNELQDKKDSLLSSLYHSLMAFFSLALYLTVMKGLECHRNRYIYQIHAVDLQKRGFRALTVL